MKMLFAPAALAAALACGAAHAEPGVVKIRSEEHTSELQSL